MLIDISFRHHYSTHSNLFWSLLHPSSSFCITFIIIIIIIFIINFLSLCSLNFLLLCHYDYFLSYISSSFHIQYIMKMYLSYPIGIIIMIKIFHTIITMVIINQNINVIWTHEIRRHNKKRLATGRSITQC